MKFFFLIFILLNASFYGFILKKKEKEENIVLKLTESYYNRIGHEHIDEFRNMLFRELDSKQKILEKHLFNYENIYKATNKTKLKRVNVNNSIDLHNNTQKRSEETGNVKIFAGEYTTTCRIIKFYISHLQKCSVFINDTIAYENINNRNFVEHMILHNNAEVIDPKGVYSDDININFFAFNRKLNIFSVYFDNKANKTNNFTIEYDYDAIGLIKSNIVLKDELNQVLQQERKDNTFYSMNQAENLTNFNKVNNNNFIWKILNQNFIKTRENVTLQVFFELGKDFQHEDVEFSLNFTKSIKDQEGKNLVKYEWNGMIEPQEVLVLQAKFPLYFEHCGNLSINLVMIFVGAIFIIFLIGMLYIIISTVFLDEI